MVYKTVLWSVVLGLLSGVAGLGGCSFHAPPPSAQQTAQLAKLRYPKQPAVVVEDLDIVIDRDDGMLTLHNRTPNPYAHVELWLNQQYVCYVDLIPVGTVTQLPLNGFINEFSELFPVGGLLSPDKSAPVLLAEMYQRPATHSTASGPSVSAVPGKRYRLLVRKEASGRVTGNVGDDDR